jgi:hypothetical protein
MEWNDELEMEEFLHLAWLSDALDHMVGEY